MNFMSFINRITEVENVPLKYFILDPELPLDVYFGLDSMGRPTLLIEDIEQKFNVAEIPSTAQILVRSFMRKTKACLSFSLLSSEHRDVFNTLCYDLFEATRCNTREQALLSLLARFTEWQGLLKGIRPGVMTIQEQQGLVAELMAFLYFTELKGFDDVLDAWVGPFKLDKDFEFFEEWAEVKSCKVSATSVTISSIEQLDASLSGRLFVYHIDRSPENKEDAFSLSNIVERVRSIATSAATRMRLDQKLLLAKYYDGEPQYEKKRFKVYCRDIYTVNETFPCLHRDELDSAITSCQYSISLPAINKFKEV